MVVVAYRKATISLADEVVYVEGGRVLDRGTHDELLAHGAGDREVARAYRDVVGRQMDEESVQNRSVESVADDEQLYRELMVEQGGGQS